MKKENVEPTKKQLAAKKAWQTRRLNAAKKSIEKRVTKKTVAKKKQGRPAKIVSDGSTAKYYELPKGATELQHLISHKNMNAQLGEIFRAAYRYGESGHSDALRDAKKIKYYIEAEIKRLTKWAK